MEKNQILQKNMPNKNKKCRKNEGKITLKNEKKLRNTEADCFTEK